MKAGDIDVFLGNWMPAHAEFRADLDAAKAVEVLNQNLTGAKFTLAVPSYVGIADFAELDPNAERFGSKIYGIDPGTGGNAIIQGMIEDDDFGLGDWELVETSEQAMLAQVERAEKSEDAIVFLAWAPHPMNVAHDITYLAGGDAQFGPNYGGADVFTLARTGWAEECPNAAQLFRNLTFTVDVENEIMALILDEGESPADGRRDLAQGASRTRSAPGSRGSPPSAASPASTPSSPRSGSDGARAGLGGHEAPARPARGGRPPWASLRRSGRSGREISCLPACWRGPGICPIGFHASMIPRQRAGAGGDRRR